jgi:hypothetical protein
MCSNRDRQTIPVILLHMNLRITISVIVLSAVIPVVGQVRNPAATKIRTSELKSAAYRDAVRTMHDYWPDEEWVREDNIRGFQVKYAFGDLTRDGIEEAAVSVSYNFGGSGGFTGVFVYSSDRAAVKLIGYIKGGDRAQGGIKSVRIANRQLIVETYGSDENDCMACYGSVLTTRYEWFDGKLVNVGGDMREFRFPKRAP